MRTHVLGCMTMMFFSTLMYSQTSQSVSFTFSRGEKNLYFPTKENDKLIHFTISGITETDISVFEQNAVSFDGVMSFSVSPNPQPGIYDAVARFSPYTDCEYFKEFFRHMGISKVIIEDTEILPEKLFTLSQSQFQELENLNYQIAQIELKIKWVWENSRQQATQDGWFDDAYHNLSMAKEAKSQFINTLK